jgi:hypothetical protein
MRLNSISQDGMCMDQCKPSCAVAYRYRQSMKKGRNDQSNLVMWLPRIITSPELNIGLSVSNKEGSHWNASISKGLAINFNQYQPIIKLNSNLRIDRVDGDLWTLKLVARLFWQFFCGFHAPFWPRPRPTLMQLANSYGARPCPIRQI